MNIGDGFGLPFSGRHGGGGNPGTTAPPPQTAPNPPLSQGCRNALAAAKQNASAIDRAYQSQDLLQQAADKHGIDWELLAAIGVRETGFTSINQRGGGGRGIFQIDIYAHPGMGKIAKNPTRAANYAAGLLESGINRYSDTGYSDELVEAAAVRDYNAGSKYTMNKLAGGIPALDRGTTSNYASKVPAIANNCFTR